MPTHLIQRLFQARTGATQPAARTRTAAAPGTTAPGSAAPAAPDLIDLSDAVADPAPQSEPRSASPGLQAPASAPAHRPAPERAAPPPAQPELFPFDSTPWEAAPQGGATQAAATQDPPTGSQGRTAPLTREGLKAWSKQAPFFERMARKSFASELLHAMGPGPDNQEMSLATLSLVGPKHAGLKSLPPGLRVSHHLYMCNLDLKELPENMDVKALTVVACPKLTSLPEGIEAEQVALYHCAIKKWPERMQINGNLHLKHCYEIGALPPEEKIRGDIKFTGGVDIGENAYADSRHLTAGEEKGKRTLEFRPKLNLNKFWDSLPEQPIDDKELENLTCPIGLELLPEVERAVFWRRDGRILGGAQLEEFGDYWKKTGKDPCSMLDLPQEAIFKRAIGKQTGD